MTAVIVDCVQGSAAWHRARLGRITSSELKRLVTPKKLELSEQLSGYVSELLAQWALGDAYLEEEAFLGSHWTERGRAYEAEALDALSVVADDEPRPVGLVYQDETKRVSCSPDMLLGSDGGAEIKCPAAKTHIGYLLGGGVPDEYRLQVQGSLWITGRQWWIFESYHPALPAHIVRVEREPEVQTALELAADVALEALEEGKARLRELGVRAD